MRLPRVGGRAAFAPTRPPLLTSLTYDPSQNGHPLKAGVRGRTEVFRDAGKLTPPMIQSF